MTSWKVNVFFIATFALCGFVLMCICFLKFSCLFDELICSLPGLLYSWMFFHSPIQLLVLQYPLNYKFLVVLRWLWSSCFIVGMLSSVYVSIFVLYSRWTPTSFSYLSGSPSEWLSFLVVVLNKFVLYKFLRTWLLGLWSHGSLHVSLLGLFILQLEILLLWVPYVIMCLGTCFDSLVHVASRFCQLLAFLF